MDNIKNDEFYLKKIIKDLNFLIAHTQTLALNDIKKDEVLLDSIMFRLVQISENSGKLTDDFKKNNKNVSWGAIRGLRNRIVHDYGEVDLTIIYNAVKIDIPELLTILQKI